MYHLSPFENCKNLHFYHPKVGLIAFRVPRQAGITKENIERRLRAACTDRGVKIRGLIIHPNGEMAADLGDGTAAKIREITYFACRTWRDECAMKKAGNF